MRQATFRTAGVIAFIFLMACCAFSQTQTLNIWPGAAPGSENWTQKATSFDTPIGTVVFNVVTPTLTVYLERTKATGTGIIIGPGEALVALTIDLEGNDVAPWFQDKGIAAFVLKYRMMKKRQEGIPQINMDEAGKYGIADGIQALKVVRQHAAEWGIKGFSAGAMVTSGALLQQDAAARPNFAAPIYLWWTVRSDASHSGKTAAHFLGMGTGRRRGPQRCG